MKKNTWYRWRSKKYFQSYKKKKICVVNSDIFWTKKNKSHIKYFLSNYQDVSHCKMLLSKDINFLGLKKENGDFNLKRNVVINWKIKMRNCIILVFKSYLKISLIIEKNIPYE